MSYIQTVRGRIAPEELGFCQTHEHVWCDIRMSERTHIRSTVSQGTGGIMYYDDKERQLDELKAYYELGGRALVDVTTNHWRPDTETLVQLSEDSGVHLVLTGGFYTEPSVPFWVDDTPVREITEILIRELTEGDPETGVKVGLYKSGIWRGRIEGPEMKGLRAVCRAILETGAAMTTHTGGARRYEVPGGTMGISHLNVFREEGVPAHRLIVGHVDERPDVNVLSQLAEAGCYIQFDVIGKLHWLMDETRAHLIRELKRRGYLDRLLLGTDRCRIQELYKDQGGLGFTYLFDRFFDVLKAEGGLSDDDITTIMVENPARALTLTS